MSEAIGQCRKQIVELHDTVAEASDFFLSADEDLYDGHQTAREVLSHIVFWHREFSAITHAIKGASNQQLQIGTYAELNLAACREFSDLTMEELVQLLQKYHQQLTGELENIDDWTVEIPTKSSGRLRSLDHQVASITAHICNHVKRLKRAERLGEAWVNAYYPDAYEYPHD